MRKAVPKPCALRTCKLLRVAVCLVVANAVLYGGEWMGVIPTP